MAEKTPNKELLDKIQAKLECSICLTDYTEPKLLPCFHVFCKKCLEPLVIQNRDGLSLQCPICRHSIQLPPKGVSGLQSDFHVDHLFEIRDAFQKANQVQKTKCEKCEEDNATGFCRDCGEFICDACTTVHRKWKQFKSHGIISLEEVQTEAADLVRPKKQVLYCKKHPECDLRIFCETCSELICTDCTIGDHPRPEHSYQLVTDAFSKHKDEILDSLQPVREQLATVTKAFQTIEERVKEIEERKMTIEAAIHKEINLLQQALEHRRTELISEIDHLTQLKLKNLAAQRDQVELVHVKLSSCVHYVEGGLKTGSEGEVLSVKAPVMKRIEQITSDFNPVTMQPKEEANLELYAFNKQSLFQACQQFGNINTPNEISPEKSYVEELLKKSNLKVGTKAVATVSTMTYAHRKYTHPTTITAELVHCKSKATVQCDIEKQQNSQYKITYQPTHRGKHELHIKINGREIRDSPYTIAVTSSPQSLGQTVNVFENLAGPGSTTTNSQNQIIVTEEDSHCVSVFSPEGEKIISFGTKGSEDGKFKYPTGVCVDSEGNIYVADRRNHRIQKFAADGKLIKAVGRKGSGELQFNCPLGMVYNDKNHKIYVCDQGNSRILILNTDLTYNRTFGSRGSENGNFLSIFGIAANSNGDVFVADYSNNKVQVFDEAGNFLQTFSMKGQEQTLQHPWGIAIDSNDTVYVSEYDSHCISVFTAEGKYLRTFGSKGIQKGQFSYPRGLHIDKTDTLLVCDKSNRIQFFC